MNNAYIYIYINIYIYIHIYIYILVFLDNCALACTYNDSPFPRR